MNDAPRTIDDKEDRRARAVHGLTVCSRLPRLDGRPRVSDFAPN